MKIDNKRLLIQESITKSKTIEPKHLMVHNMLHHVCFWLWCSRTFAVYIPTNQCISIKSLEILSWPLFAKIS